MYGFSAADAPSGKMTQQAAAYQTSPKNGQRCTDCATWRHIPRDMCAKCGSFEWEWARSSGKGTVFSWTTAMQPMMPQFADKIPYSPVIVELDEGVRMVTWLTDVKPDELKLGMPVELVFDDVTPTVALPLFRRAA